jgi:YtcA family
MRAVPGGYMSRELFALRPVKTAKRAFAPGTKRARKAALLMFVTLLALGGCSNRGAPSFVLFGAFFPAWMLCAFIGILGAIAARGIFVAAGLASIVPFQLFVCSSAGLVVAVLTWLVWFGT